MAQPLLCSLQTNRLLWPRPSIRRSSKGRELNGIQFIYLVPYEQIMGGLNCLMSKMNVNSLFVKFSSFSPNQRNSAASLTRGGMGTSFSFSYNSVDFCKKIVFVNKFKL